MLHKRKENVRLLGPSMFAIKAKMYGVLYKQSSLVSIGQHLVTMNTNIKIEADLNTGSDQAMWAVHSCNSWF